MWAEIDCNDLSAPSFTLLSPYAFSFTLLAFQFSIVKNSLKSHKKKLSDLISNTSLVLFRHMSYVFVRPNQHLTILCFWSQTSRYYIMKACLWTRYSVLDTKPAFCTPTFVMLHEQQLFLSLKLCRDQTGFFLFVCLFFNNLAVNSASYGVGCLSIYACLTFCFLCMPPFC